MKPKNIFLITADLPYLAVSAVYFLAVGLIFTFMRIFSLLNLIAGTPLLMVFEKLWPDECRRITIPDGVRFCVGETVEDWVELYEKFRMING
ncbi:hypothetical protein [Neisseria musculi]|uniref:Cell wall surface anchor family protein n=1 Tax=Neisseria musculi TaxID=1815583 RepID=A0A7H1M886_9NEIS|nr:hypothetical protein [Neisseria musculi]QNT57851.1 cell wall surface anchor family protein [Neisseria musculi]